MGQIIFGISLIEKNKESHMIHTTYNYSDCLKYLDCPEFGLSNIEETDDYKNYINNIGVVSGSIIAIIQLKNIHFSQAIIRIHQISSSKKTNKILNIDLSSLNDYELNDVHKKILDEQFNRSGLNNDENLFNEIFDLRHNISNIIKEKTNHKKLEIGDKVKIWDLSYIMDQNKNTNFNVEEILEEDFVVEELGYYPEFTAKDILENDVINDVKLSNYSGKLKIYIRHEQVNLIL